MKKKKEPNVEELMKAMAIELRPIEELKKPVAHPENFDLFMAKAIKIKPKVKKKGTRNKPLGILIPLTNNHGNDIGVVQVNLIPFCTTT